MNVCVLKKNHILGLTWVYIHDDRNCPKEPLSTDTEQDIA